MYITPAGARHGETPRGETPRIPISNIFSKRQALSRAGRRHNMSRGKCLAREGPGSRLHCNTLSFCFLASMKLMKIMVVENIGSCVEIELVFE